MLDRGSPIDSVLRPSDRTVLSAGLSPPPCGAGRSERCRRQGPVVDVAACPRAARGRGNGRSGRRGPPLPTSAGSCERSIWPTSPGRPSGEPAGIAFFVVGAQGLLFAPFVTNAAWGDLDRRRLALVVVLARHHVAARRRTGAYLAFHPFSLGDFLVAVGTGLTFIVSGDPLMRTLLDTPMALIPLWGDHGGRQPARPAPAAHREGLLDASRSWVSSGARRRGSRQEPGGSVRDWSRNGRQPVTGDRRNVARGDQAHRVQRRGPRPSPRWRSPAPIRWAVGTGVEGEPEVAQRPARGGEGEKRSSSSSAKAISSRAASRWSAGSATTAVARWPPRSSGSSWVGERQPDEGGVGAVTAAAGEACVGRPTRLVGRAARRPGRRPTGANGR